MVDLGGQALTDAMGNAMLPFVYRVLVEVNGPDARVRYPPLPGRRRHVARRGRSGEEGGVERGERRGRGGRHGWLLRCVGCGAAVWMALVGPGGHPEREAEEHFAPHVFFFPSFLLGCGCG